jgi:hypothetical protein
MSKLAWYWHRLRAMSPGEMLLHARKKLRQAADAKRTSWPEADLAGSEMFPKLPKPEDAPEMLREVLRRDVENILAGRWRFFGHLEVQVDDPPRWQFDYLVRRDVESAASAFKLNYRSLAEGVDSKLVWEPSRWNQLVRLAMVAYVLGDRRAGEKCIEWLEDWVKRNPPYRGWNWTSALEVGLRLIQFAWIEALLTQAVVSGFGFRVLGSEPALREDGPPSPPPTHPGGGARREGERNPQILDRLEHLRLAILPPHVWYAWRHKSFGSSANNHLLGELVGCIVATVRWPGLAKCGASLEELQQRWEHEVLAQFAEDGGNKEQALNYQLFSWEFCWQARMALASAGRKISPEVDERLRRAAQFFVDVQVPGDPWDYGDSDNAFVTPLFADDRKVVAEWHEWFRKPAKEQALEFWMGAARRDLKLEISDFKAGEWRHSADSGYALRREGDWTVRWDLSPLGLGTMAAHGHLDALHVSLWLRGVALVIDPGTGAYHADRPLRDWLASREAHNGVLPAHWFGPNRLGAFIWSAANVATSFEEAGWGAFSAKWTPKTDECSDCAPQSLYRRLQTTDRRIEVFDKAALHGRRETADEFDVRWQLAPGSLVEDLGQRRFRVTRRGVTMEVHVSADWAEVWCVTEQSQVAQADPDAPLAGTVSPAFRKTVWASYLKLVARPRGDKPCVFSTTFLASAHS